MSSDVLQHQIDYYRARAGEYDEWFYRRGRYDRGEASTWQWYYEAGVVREQLRALGRFDQVLELACGTGIWTQELVKLGGQVTAIDASPEVLDVNRAKLQSTRIRYLQADLFSWTPDRAYDLVFFSFWLSHVPPDLLDPFLTKVASATRPGGQVFLIDSRPDPTSVASNHEAPSDDDIYSVRKLNDGSAYRIVKVFYEPTGLRESLDRAGFDASAAVTDYYFIYASGRRR